MCGRGLESWNVKSQSHVTCVASLTNGQMTHVHSVVTLNMCPRSHVLTCLSSCDVQICRWKSESPSHQSISLSPDYITASPHSAHPSSNTISAHIPISLRSWQHIHFHPQWRNQSVASQPTWVRVSHWSVLLLLTTQSVYYGWNWCHGQKI